MQTETNNPVASSKTSPSDAGDALLLQCQLRTWGLYRKGMALTEMREVYRVRRVEEDRKFANAKAAAQSQRQPEVEAAMRETLSRHGIDAAAMGAAELSERYAAERIAWEKRRKEDADNAERRKRSERLFAASECPKRHVLNMDAVGTGNPGWTAVRDDLVKRLGPTGYLVPLLGRRGTGKTQLAVSVIHRACMGGMSARYVKALDLFRLIRGAYTPVRRGEAGESESDVIDQFANYGLLVIDELHQRAETDFERNTLVNLLDRRYDAMLCTIAIANQDRAEFSAAMDDSVKSRILETGAVIECNWDSYRKPGMWNEQGGAA